MRLLYCSLRVEAFGSGPLKAMTLVFLRPLAFFYMLRYYLQGLGGNPVVPGQQQPRVAVLGQRQPQGGEGQQRAQQQQQQPEGQQPRPETEPQAQADA